MSAGGRIVEGVVETARLPLWALRASPAAAAKPAPPRALLLGGSNFDLRLKRGFLDTALVDVCDVVAYEPRGLGRSGRPAGAWTMADYADDAAALMDALGWRDAAVIGESFGGMTALHLALRHADRVTRLALISATAGGAGGASYDISTYLEKTPRDAARDQLILQDTANAELQHVDPDAFAARLEARLAFDTAFRDPSVFSGGYARLLAARRGHDVWDRLGRITAPVDVIAGRRDGQAPLAAQRRMAERLPRARFRAYPGGHGIAFTDPQVMRDLLNSWDKAATVDAGFGSG